MEGEAETSSVDTHVMVVEEGGQEDLAPYAAEATLEQEATSSDQKVAEIRQDLVELEEQPDPQRADRASATAPSADTSSFETQTDRDIDDGIHSGPSGCAARPASSMQDASTSADANALTSTTSSTSRDEAEGDTAESASHAEAAPSRRPPSGSQVHVNIAAGSPNDTTAVAQATEAESGSRPALIYASSRPSSGTSAAHTSRPPSARPASARIPSSQQRSSRPTSSTTAENAVPLEVVARSLPRSLSQQESPQPPLTPKDVDEGSVSPLAAPPAALLPAPPPASRPPPLPHSPLEQTHDLKHVAPGLKALDVEVPQGPGLPFKVVRVLLDSTQLDRKAYLGGYRSKASSTTYLHATTQTPRQPKYSEADRKLSRDTQTVKIRQHSQQTTREAATQMARPGVVIDETYDRERTPGKYQTADERAVTVEAATRTIQRWARGWASRKRAAYLREKKLERELFLREQDLQAQQAAEEHRCREVERRMHPRSAADFDTLYNELEAWRLQETRKIKEAGLPRQQEQEVLQQLLHKETKLLQTIDRLKINANHENKDVRIQRSLCEMGKPKRYELKNGGKVEVHTPFTTRAKELHQLYNGLNLPMLTVDERLDVLLHVKWTVKEFECNLTREMVDLIDREADLLNRGRSPKMLEGLRKRISSLFLNFIETPEFNPEASRFQIVPMDFETYLYDQAGRPPANMLRAVSAR